jgi:hypothetical protein
MYVFGHKLLRVRESINVILYTKLEIQEGCIPTVKLSYMLLMNCLLEEEGKHVLFITVSSAMIRFSLITVTFVFATIFKHLCSTPGISWRRKGRGASCKAVLSNRVRRTVN